jgi:type IX secretion system PorP/SprF family membrane protein
MKKFNFTLLFLVSTICSFGQQDRHFSMFFESPVLLNPGAAGHGTGDMSFFSNFRTQWFTVSNQPFRTVSASFDTKLLDGSFSKGFIGTGINFVNDVSGDSKYTLNTISVPINYSIQVGKKSYLAVGLQPGMYAQKISENALYFDSQWNGGGFDQGMSSGETLGDFNLSRFDFSAGVFYNSTLSENFSYQVGISAFHLTAQKVSFYQISEKLYRNFTLYSQFNIWQPNSKVSFHPALFALKQGPNWEITLGSNFEFALKEVSQHTGYFDGMAISLGVYYRSADALLTNIMYRAGALSVGVGYDLNFSNLSIASKSVGAVEVFLKFVPKFESSLGAPRIH